MRGYSIVALHNPKSRENVGSALRAAQVYGSSAVVISGKRYQSSCTDTMKAYRHLPLMQTTDDVMAMIPYDCVPVAIEFVADGRPLQSYPHPERAFYVFGSEDNGLPQEIIRKCRDVVYIPTKRSMNLAATVNVVLYDRMAKESMLKQRPVSEGTKE